MDLWDGGWGTSGFKRETGRSSRVFRYRDFDGLRTFCPSGRVCGPVRTVAAGVDWTRREGVSAGHRALVNMTYKVYHISMAQVTTLLQGVGTFEELKFVPWSARSTEAFSASFIPMKAASAQGGKAPGGPIIMLRWYERYRLVPRFGAFAGLHSAISCRCIWRRCSRYFCDR